MVSGSKIIPHTDSKNKIATFMLYLPSPEQENLDLGTSFFRPISKKSKKYSNFNNLTAKTEKFPLLYPLFYDEMEIFYKSKFQYENLICFVKNDMSWHSVQPLEISPHDSRVSINFNFYKTKPSIFTHLIFHIKGLF